MIPLLEDSAGSGIVGPIDISRYCGRAGNYEKAMEWLEKAYEAHDPNMFYILCGNFPGELMDHPGFIELLKKMNIPVD